MALMDVQDPVILETPAPLPAVVVLPITSPHLADNLSNILSSTSTALTLLPFYTRAVTQKLVVHSLLLSSPSQSLLLTFASLTPTSPLPPPLVSLLTTAPISLLLPTALSKRQLKAALSTWQRPPNFTLASTIAYVTPFLIDLLSLSPSTDPPVSPSWQDQWSLQPPSGAANEYLKHLVAYSAEQLLLYTCAHAISTAFTDFAQEQLRQVHAFNLRFVPLLPVSPYRFTLDAHVESTLPMMRLPANHRVHITSNHADAERAIAHLVASLPAQQQPLVGFDTESRAMFVAGQPNRPISLVQLSSLSVSVLCRVRRETGLPPALVRLLVDPKVRKVGQGIGGDMRLLHAQYSGTSTTADTALPDTLLSSPSSHSLIDLESLSSSYSIHRVGLASLTAAFLSLRLSKAAQLSNWERPTLTNEQISYAALDALVSLKLAQRLQRLRDDMHAVVRGWVEREKAGGGAVDEAMVWLWLTGKGLPGLVEARDENGEPDVSRRQQARQPRHKQATQRAADSRPQPASVTEHQAEHKYREKKRRSVQSTQSVERSGSRKPRRRSVMRSSDGQGPRSQAVSGDSGRSVQPGAAPQIIASL